MKEPLLFEHIENKTIISQNERDRAIEVIVQQAKYGTKFFYSAKECCALLQCSIDHIYKLIHTYFIDVVLFLNIYRIPWYELASFLLIELEDTLMEDYYEFIKHNKKR